MFVERVFCGTLGSRPRWRGHEVLPRPALSTYPPGLSAPSHLYSPHSQLLLQVLPPGSLLSYSWVLLSAFFSGGATGQLEMLPSHGEVESKCVSPAIPLPTLSKLATGLGDP